MGQIIRIVNIIFLLIILILFHNKEARFCDWLYIGTTWILLEIIAEYIKSKYISDISAYGIKTEEYIDPDKPISKKEYPKIISIIVFLIINTFIYFHCKIKNYDDTFSIASSIIFILLSIAICYGLFSKFKNLLSSIIKK